MSSKFWYLTSISLKKKMKTKWFLIANIILAIVIIGLINIDGIISFFGGDFNDKTNIVLLDKTGYASDVFEKNLEETNTMLANDYQTEYEIYQKDEESLKEIIMEIE